MKLRIAVLATPFIFGILWVLLSPALATNLIVSRPLEKADAIIVLSGSAVYKERTQRAAELYRVGSAPRILISDDGKRAGWYQKELQNLRFIDLEKRELIANGVQEADIVELPGIVSGTDDEARAAANYAHEAGIRSLMVVTSAYHSRRALWTFDKLAVPSGIKIGIDPVPPGIQTPAPTSWWMRPRGWQTVALEYVKLLDYWMFY